MLRFEEFCVKVAGAIIRGNAWRITKSLQLKLVNLCQRDPCDPKLSMVGERKGGLLLSSPGDLVNKCLVTSCSI